MTERTNISENVMNDSEADILRDLIERINAFIREGAYDAAIEQNIIAYERALALDQPYWIAEILSLFGLIEHDQGHIKKAMTYMSKALAMGRDSGNISSAVNALNTISGIYGLYGEYRLAIQGYMDLLNLIEDHPEVQGKRISVYNNLGFIFQQMEDFETAEKYYLDGLALAKDLYQSNPDQRTIFGILYSNLAEVHFFKKSYASAHSYLKKSHKISTELNDHIGIANSYYIEALLSYEIDQDWSKAFSLFTDAVLIMEHYGADYELNELKISFGRSALKAGEISIAQSLLEEALVHAKEFLYVQMEPAICTMLQEIYASNLDYKKAYEMACRLLELKKSFAEQWENTLIRDITDELRNEVDNRQVKELRRTIQTMKLLAEVGQAVTTTLDIRHIFDILANSLTRVLELASFAIGIYGENTDQIYNHVHDDGVYRDSLIDLNNEDSFMAWCIRNRKEIVIYNSQDREHNAKIVTPHLANRLEKTEIKSLLFCPMMNGADIIGGITFQSRQGLTFVDLEALRLLTSYISIAISNIRKSQSLIESNKKLETASRVDSLTGLLNRRALGVYITHTLEKTNASLLPLTIIMIDLDYFKQYNDFYGHNSGDMCLISISTTIKNVLKNHQQNHGAYRFGGDEFLIIIEHCPESSCREIIKDLSARIHELKIEHAKSKISDYVTLTAGACIVNRSFSDYTEAFSRADEALYIAKGNGRNTSVVLTLD